MRNNQTNLCVKGMKNKKAEMFGLLQFCLFLVFAESCRADTGENEGSFRSSIISLCLIPKHDEKEVKERKHGFLPACVIWLSIR